MMKKSYSLILTVAVVSLLGACSAKGEQTTKSTSTSTSHSKKVTSVTSSQKQVRKETTSSVSRTKQQAQSQSQTKQAKALWDSNKKQDLATFMSSWGTTMGQTYQSYDLTRDTDYAGIHFPSKLAQTDLAVDDTPVTAAWSTDGTGSADYNVVAIYCDVDGGTVGGHLYLFTFHNGQPVVLITSQNRGTPDNRLHFSVTANTDLKTGFANIVSGQGSGQANTSQPTTSAVSPISAAEAQAILAKQNIEYHVGQPEPQGNNASLPGGGIILKQYYGAQGIKIFKLTPKPGNKVNITVQEGTIKDGQGGLAAPISQNITVDR
ncbi:DUF4767 domain-containing protein [Latilactobacillus sakei]|nr:DUF4767 domain-containing protein [Latilactobacillus sakei]MCP8854923.1 DUF4767 domain-containing protein [Latilactobacillus sakei]SON72542.1 putative lipoprotein [Latilactobacillus sakei]